MATPREKAAKRGKGRRRKAKKRRAPRPVKFGRQHFQVRLIRRGLPDASLDPYLEQLSWERHGRSRTGQLQIRLPVDRAERDRVRLRRGDVVAVTVAIAPGRPHRPLWRMRVSTPEHQVKDGIVAVSLRSGLAREQRSKVHWRFRRDRSHPTGWRADQIGVHCAGRFRIPVGKLAKGRHRIRKLGGKASPVAMVARAYKIEHEKTGRRFDVSTADGALNVTELRRPGYMLVLGPHALDATVSEPLPRGFVSAVVVVSPRKEGKPIRVKVVDRRLVKEHGYVVRTITRKDLDTAAEARREGKRYIARHSKVKRRVTITHPGIPFVDRGDAVMCRLEKADVRQLVYVAEAAHTLTSASYEMELVLAVDDPFGRDAAGERARRKRQEARQRRNRRGGEPPARPKPAKAARRR